MAEALAWAVIGMLISIHLMRSATGDAMHFAFAHNGIFVAVIAHGLIGVTLVWDKVLLRQPETRNLFSYVFWLGFISIFGLALIPFGFHIPQLTVIALAFGAGLLHMAAMFFYYAALKAGEASQTLAIMGGFSPVATALISIPLLRNPIGGRVALVGFLLLVTGGFIMFLAEKTDIRKVLPSVILASATYGLVNVLQKLAFDRTNFVSGYVFFTLGTFAGALMLLIPPSWRRQIFKRAEKHRPQNWFWYFVNRFFNGLGSFLVFYAISLTRPALVDAITGLRYAIIFGISYALTLLRPRWLREEFSGAVLFGKLLATAFVVAGLVLVALRGSGPQAGTSQLLPLKQDDAAHYQNCRHPAPHFYVFSQDILGQNRFQNVAARGGRYREAHVSDGEQRQHSEEPGGQRRHSDNDQRIADCPRQHPHQAPQIQSLHLGFPLHACGVQHVAECVTHRRQGYQPPSQADHSDSRCRRVVRSGVISASSTPRMISKIPIHRTLDTRSFSTKRPMMAIKT